MQENKISIYKLFPDNVFCTHFDHPSWCRKHLIRILKVAVYVYQTALTKHVNLI